MNGVAVVGADPQREMVRAVESGGGTLTCVEEAGGLVWGGGPDEVLGEVLGRAGRVRWVQLPSAGIEDYTDAIACHHGMTWTCAKGIYGPAVAEHALAMLLALRRGLLVHCAARHWTPDAPGVPLVGSGATVTLLGGGGIAAEFARLLAPFDLPVRVVRRRPAEGFPAAHVRIFAEDELDEALAGADVLVITLPLTARTCNLLGERELRLLAHGAVVVNVGRGGVLDQAALLALLEDATLSGAALDVTRIEPLPPQDPLWSHPRCLITSHTSNPSAWRRRQFAALVQDNVSRFLTGAELRGRVDVDAGY